MRDQPHKTMAKHMVLLDPGISTELSILGMQSIQDIRGPAVWSCHWPLTIHFLGVPNLDPYPDGDIYIIYIYIHHIYIYTLYITYIDIYIYIYIHEYIHMIIVASLAVLWPAAGFSKYNSPEARPVTNSSFFCKYVLFSRRDNIYYYWKGQAILRGQLTSDK